MKKTILIIAVLLLFLIVSMVASLLPADSSAQIKRSSDTATPGEKEPALSAPNTLNKVYRDESHCLTLADLRGDQDKSISCFCHDAVVDARYVYFSYLLVKKDQNLNGVFLVLVDRIQHQCGHDSNTALDVAMRQNWKWNGPEVVRTYPPDDVIKRIKPKDGVRSVPFTIQLIYRDDKGQITHTENYSSYYPDLRFK